MYPNDDWTQEEKGKEEMGQGRGGMRGRMM